MQHLLDSAKDLGYIPINTAVAKAKGMMAKIRSGELKPLFTSLQKETDAIGGFYPTDQVVIAGRTGTGKSAKMFHMMRDFVDFKINPFYKDRLLILLDSFEMADWRVILRLISREGSVPVKDLLDYHKRLTDERFTFLMGVADVFKDLPIFINTRPCTAIQWVEKKKQMQGLFPKHTIINIFDHTRLAKKDDEKKEEELISNVMFQGMYLKNNFDMINFFLSQMNRNIETNTSRDKLGTNLPVASDIFGSDAVFQCADLVMALHRPGQYGLQEFNGFPTGVDPNDPEKPDDLLIECILKQREGWTGNLFLRHNLGLNHFEDYPDPSAEFKKLNEQFGF